MTRKRKTNMAGRTAQSPVRHVCPVWMFQPELPGIDETAVSSNADTDTVSNHEQNSGQHDHEKAAKGSAQMQIGHSHPAPNPDTAFNLNADGVLQTLDRHMTIGTLISEPDSTDTKTSLTTSSRTTPSNDHVTGGANVIRNNFPEARGSGSYTVKQEELLNEDSTGRTNLTAVASPFVPPMHYSIKLINRTPTTNITVRVQVEHNGRVIQLASSKPGVDDGTMNNQTPVTMKVRIGIQTDERNSESGKFRYLGDNLMMKIAAKENLMLAIKHVRKYGGKSAGIDGKSVKQACDEAEERIDELSLELMEGKFQPAPGRRVWIPKGDGKKRGLSIPTAIDRIVARAVQQTIEPLLEPGFHKSSHGYRKGRSVFTAARQSRGMIDKGHEWAIGVDIEKFFDSVDHSLLMEKIRQITGDMILITLIWKFLRSGIMVDGKLTAADSGLPQGAPLSPLLSNIILNGLDWFLEGEGYEFSRYADDVVVFTKSKEEAERIMTQASEYLRDEMHLKVNVMKSVIGPAAELSSLGLSFRDDSYGVSEEAAAKFQKRIWNMTNPVNREVIDFRMLKAVQAIKGWATHFGNAPDKRRLIELMTWARSMVRKVQVETGLPSAGAVVRTIDEWLTQQGQTIPA